MKQADPVATRLLMAASVLMLMAGCIFGMIGQWILAVLVGAGALGCGMAALNLKGQKDDPSGGRRK